MNKDPQGLLFARNIRLSLGNTPVNKEIRSTFNTSPKEFVFSNNGITMLCEDANHDVASGELTIVNPRIVNGSQTLHSIRDTESPSPNARIMVRVITLRSSQGGELSDANRKRREIVHKISIRSNLQNPVKKWNLISNDDFQQGVARYFRKKGLFYERRAKEWSYRRTALRNVGVKRGPEVRELTQLVASYYWQKKGLGPAAAKVSVGALFDDKPYAMIRTASPQLCYQLYLVSEIVYSCFQVLASQRKFIANLEGHSGLTLFSVIVRSLQAAGAPWGLPEFGEFLSQQIERPQKSWFDLTNSSIRQIVGFYRAEAKSYRRREGKELTFNNYFKSAYVNKILKGPLRLEQRRQARKLVSGK